MIEINVNESALFILWVQSKLGGGSQQQGQRISYNKRSNRRFSVRANVKQIAFDQHSRAALQAGIDKLADCVGLTLGPRGMIISCSFTFTIFFCVIYLLIFLGVYIYYS